MKSRIPLAFLCCLVVSSSPVSVARTRSHARTIDVSYGSALAAANRFLHAWQAQDHESGIMMLTDSARQRVSPDKLQDFFSPGDRAAYEIQRGKRLNGGEYAFPVVLFGISQTSQPHSGSLVIVRMGKDDWAVNRLP